VFVLERDMEKHSLVLKGYVVNVPGNFEPLDEKGGHVIPFRDCCEDNDAFRIRAEAQGSEFIFHVAVEDIRLKEEEGRLVPDPGKDRIDTGVEYFVEPFKDRRSLFRYGSVGMFEPDDTSQMKVESIRISAVTEDQSSPAARR
jgi:hypothetical protein